MNDSCWNTIGVRGDRSCPELEQHIHCRNCPVHAAAAVALLDSAPPADYLDDSTRHFAQPELHPERNVQSAVIFRVDAEWLALPASVVKEVANVRPIHSLPHRRRDIVLGVTNVRGELLACVSLRRILGLEEPADSNRDVRDAARQRFLVIRREEVRAVCPVHEIHGIHRFHQGDVKNVPATLANAPARYSKALLSWREHSVGVLDEQSLFHALKRTIA